MFDKRRFRQYATRCGCRFFRMGIFFSETITIFESPSAYFRSQLKVLETFYEKLYPIPPWFEISAKIQKSRLVIAGCAQNTDKYLKSVFDNIYKITPFFLEYKIILFENDSQDKTYYTLKKYAEGDSNICNGF